MSKLKYATEYFGSDDLREDVDEVLITGGDPLMSIKKLRISLEKYKKNAKNIKIIESVPQSTFSRSKRINDHLLDLFVEFSNFRFEIGINTNHPIEFWKETEKSIKKLNDNGVRIYNQNPLT